MSGRPTRERLIECIRERGSCTISDLQQQTGLSRSALRQHLTHLTRARLVTSAFERRSTGRSPRLYRLRARSDTAPPERCPVFLQGLLTAMRAWGREPVEALFPQLAARLASAHSEIRRLPDPAARLDAARRLFSVATLARSSPLRQASNFPSPPVHSARPRWGSATCQCDPDGPRGVDRSGG